MRRWTIFATLLRNWGFIEPNVRRILHWIATRNGGVSRDLDRDFAHRLLGTMKGIERSDRAELAASMAEWGVKDAPAYLIKLFTAKPQFIPKDENLSLAKRGWDAVEREFDEQAGYQAPAWLAAVLAGK